MARISRKCLNELYYHVMTQGINKEYIFYERRMKIEYYKLMYEKAKKNDVIIIAYCIMDNHVHILVRAKESCHLSKMMAQINSSYGKYYNKIKNRVGYVFRDRYRAEPIFNKTHLENCIRYIHDNPVKAGIVSKCEEYEFSSYNDNKNEIIKEIYKDIQNDDVTNYENYNFIDISNEFGECKFENFRKVCQEYVNLDFKIEENIYNVSNELKKRCGVENFKIIEFMGLKRATYYNIMKRQKKIRLLMDVPKSKV